MRIHRNRSAILLALVALAGAACSDGAPSPVGPGVTSQAPQPTATSFARVNARALSISDLQLASQYVSVNTGYTPFTLTITNPATKDFGNIYLRGELKSSQNNQQAVPATAFLAYCPSPDGIVPSGACVMSGNITGVPELALGPGTYTLQILQQQANGSMKVLDSKTVDVLLVWTAELPR